MSEGSHKPKVSTPSNARVATRSRRPVVIAGVVLAVLVAAAAGWSWLGTGSKPPTKEKAVAVTVATAATKSMPVVISTYGRVQTISSVALRARVDGVIASVRVQEGQDVNAGDLLFTLDDREFRARLKQAEGTVARDQAQLANAQRDLDRLLPLEDKNFVSKQQLDLQRSTVGALQGTLAADTAAADTARVQLSYTMITAPIAGRIGSISSKVGNNVHAADAQPLLTINQLRPIYVSIAVPQAEFPPLQQAMHDGPVKVQVSVSGETQALDVGDVSFVENAVDNMTNTVGLKATVPNADARLWPGQLVDVLITLRVEQNAVVVPSEAVQQGPDGAFVFTVKPDNTVAFRPVKVDRAIGAESVIASGVAAGDQVVTAGQLSLEAGTKVKVRGPGGKDGNGNKNGAGKDSGKEAAAEGAHP